MLNFLAEMVFKWQNIRDNTCVCAAQLSENFPPPLPPVAPCSLHGLSPHINSHLEGEMGTINLIVFLINLNFEKN
jgi:hypothetical protein